MSPRATSSAPRDLGGTTAPAEALLGGHRRKARAAGRREEDSLVADEAIAAQAKLLREVVGQEFEVCDAEIPRAPRSQDAAGALRPRPRDARRAQDRSEALNRLKAPRRRPPPKRRCSPRSASRRERARRSGRDDADRRRARAASPAAGDRRHAYGNIETREALDGRRSRCSPRSTRPRRRTRRSQRTHSRSTSRRARSPAHAARRRGCNGPTLAASASRFARNACKPCPLRGRCAPGGRRAIRVSRRQDAMRALAAPLRDERQRAGSPGP